MQAYLASKYMSGPKADAILSRTGGLKKKKRREGNLAGPSTSSTSASSSQQFAVRDDDAGWGDDSKMDEDEDLAEAVVEKDRSFKKRRVDGGKDGGGNTSGAGWTTIREGTARTPSPPPNEDENPQVVETGQPVGGLITSAQLRKTRPLDQGSKPKTQQSEEASAAAQETVYRDASGRIIDTKLMRADAARKKREREEREAAKMEWGKGLVQRDEEERKKKQLEAEKKRDLAVYKDDEELNAELKAKERWNDPAAGFLEVSVLVTKFE